MTAIDVPPPTSPRPPARAVAAAPAGASARSARLARLPRRSSALIAIFGPCIAPYDPNTPLCSSCSPRRAPSTSSAATARPRRALAPARGTQVSVAAALLALVVAARHRRDRRPHRRLLPAAGSTARRLGRPRSSWRCPASSCCSQRGRCSARRCGSRCSSSASCSRRRSTASCTPPSRARAHRAVRRRRPGLGPDRRAHHRSARPVGRARAHHHPGRDHRGIAIAIQAGLDFLGLGDMSVPTWGQMLNDGFENIYKGRCSCCGRRSHRAHVYRADAARQRHARRARAHVSVRRKRAARSPPRPARSPRSPRRSTGGARRRRLDEPPIVERVTARRRPQHERGRAAGPRPPRRLRPAGRLDIEVVHGVSLDIRKGEVHGLIGESGSGKTQTAFAVLGLLPAAATSRPASIVYEGTELADAPRARVRRLRGRRIGYIPQEPMSNLDPSFTIGSQLVEPLRKNLGLSQEGRDRAARSRCSTASASRTRSARSTRTRTRSRAAWRSACSSPARSRPTPT